MKRIKIVLGPVVFLTFFLSCTQQIPESHEKVQDEKVEHLNMHTNKYALEDLKVYNLATQLVVEKLQEPRTAEFPPTQQRLGHIDKLGDKKYRIDSWVDSQDTYGAMTRRKFSLIFNIDDSGLVKEKFEIESIGEIPEVKYHRK